MDDSPPSHLNDFPIDITYRMKRQDAWMFIGVLTVFGGLGYFYAFEADVAPFWMILGVVLVFVALVFIPTLIYESYFSKGYLLLTETEIRIPKGLIRKANTIPYADITGITFRQEQDSPVDRYLVLHRRAAEPVEIDRAYFKHDHAYQKVVATLDEILALKVPLKS